MFFREKEIIKDHVSPEQASSGQLAVAKEETKKTNVIYFKRKRTGEKKLSIHALNVGVDLQGKGENSTSEKLT